MSAARIITVLIAEDHAVVRQGLGALLRGDGHFRVVGEARTGREAVERAQALQPDVILMDIAMPELNGLEATRQILAADPAAKVLILSAHSDVEYVERANAAGAAGFLEKQASAGILTKAIREVAMGRNLFGRASARRLPHGPGRIHELGGRLKAVAARLTSRESEVLQLVAEGQANKQVAAVLGITIKTVEKHRQRLMDKLDIHQTAGLTRYAIAAGVIESSVQLTVL
jgi:DNA-binding NarL/FixJ family response regulator